MKATEAFFDSLYKGPTVTVAATSIDEMASAITTLRKARGWTQKRLALELETKQENICRWERDDWQRITIWRLADVADALGLSLELRLTLPTNSHPKAQPQPWSSEEIQRIREADALEPDLAEWANKQLADE